MTSKITTGRKGEDVAADFLRNKGYDLVARNYRYKHAEIDLIVKKGNLLVFVEVKTRASAAFGEPESFVNDKKAAKIMEGAEHFIFENNWQGHIRFDIVSVKIAPLLAVDHFEDSIH